MPKRNSQWPRVRKVALRGDARYMVDGRPHQRRLFFRDKNDALVQAEVWARERQNQGIEALEVPTALRVEATTAARLLRPFGRSILDAARYYVAHLEAEQRKSSALTVERCLEEWVGSKARETEQKILSPRTLTEIEGRAKLFAEAFGDLRVTAIDEEAVRTFVESLR